MKRQKDLALKSGSRFAGARLHQILNSGQVSVETRYYISSLESDAQRFLQAIRSHWGIENRVHWVLDVSFREDESRVRTGNVPGNLAIVRHMAPNLLRQDRTSKASIQS